MSPVPPIEAVYPPSSSGVAKTLVRHSRSQPNHPALIWHGGVVSYRALADRVDDLARRLAGLGLGPDERLAVLLSNQPVYITLVHAAAHLGAVLVALNPRLTADEIAWQVADARPQALIHDPMLAERLAELGPEITLVAAGTSGSDEEPAGPDHLVLDTLTPVESAPGALRSGLALDAPQAIVYTSGTTGRPKGAVLTHGNFLWSALASALRLGHRADDRWLVPLPLCHVGGLSVLLRCALYGTTVVLHPRFDAEAVARSLDEDAVSHVSLVPTMLQRLLEVWGKRPVPSALRVVLLGGGPASEDLAQQAADLGFPVTPTYGLTEAASQVTTAPPGRRDVKPSSAGPPLAVTGIRIVDTEGLSLPPDTAGEILVRGPTVMAGYWNQPEATAAALAGGWLHTGDVGWLDESGELFVAARRDDLIVSGGENVYPAEVEDALNAHPDIAASCVVGVPDPEWGMAVAAAVVAAPGAKCDAEAIERSLRARLAGYKIPRRIQWLEALPHTASGKPHREAIREMLVGSQVSR